MADKKAEAATENGGPRIFLVRGHKVMLDEDLAALYQLEIGALEQAVERNIESFTENLAFRLTADEQDEMRPQMANPDRATPYVFTGQGLGLLSSILLEALEAHDGEEPCAPTCSCRR